MQEFRSRKVKIVADLIQRKKNVDEALAIVKFTPKASSGNNRKLLKISYSKCRK